MIFQLGLARSDDIVYAGQIYSDNVVLNGNTFHGYSTMKGRITRHGTVKAYHGAKLDGEIDGDEIDLIISGYFTVGGKLSVRNRHIG